MNLTLTLSYDAPPSRVGRLLADAAFQRAVCAETGDPEADVRVDDTDDGISVVSSRRLPTDRLSESLRAVIGQYVVVVQSARWPAVRDDAGWTGRVVVDVQGKPVRLDARATVRADGDRTTITYEGDLVARVPLVGGKIERAVAPVVRSALTTEERVGADWLATHAD